MKKLRIIIPLSIVLIIVLTQPSALGSEIEVSGYNNHGIYLHGNLYVDSSGSVDGYLYTSRGRAVYVEGEIINRNTVEINNDDLGDGGYELDIDSW